MRWPEGETSCVEMEEPSVCNLSLAVDCTLSLGSTRTSSRTSQVPARLSRAGSPDQDLTWPLAERSGDPARRRCKEPAQAMSWDGSCCNRSDPDVSPDLYPQVSEAEGRGRDHGDRSAVRAWPRTSQGVSYKDEEKTSEALFSEIKSQSYGHRSSSRQPVWLSSYIPSVEVKAAASRVDEQCPQEGDSVARVCAHCGTSKTPLWRNGPGGPKSLCNACGIRFKKAGRRSAANGDLQLSPPSTPTGVKRPLEDQHFWVIPSESTKPRKRSRVRSADSSLFSGSCMTWQSCLLTSPSAQSMAASLAPQSPHPKSDLNLQMGSYSSDEEEGAVLLMALSCGLVHA